MAAAVRKAPITPAVKRGLPWIAATTLLKDDEADHKIPAYLWEVDI